MGKLNLYVKKDQELQLSIMKGVFERKGSSLSLFILDQAFKAFEKGKWKEYVREDENYEIKRGTTESDVKTNKRTLHKRKGQN